MGQGPALAVGIAIGVTLGFVFGAVATSRNQQAPQRDLQLRSEVADTLTSIPSSVPIPR